MQGILLRRQSTPIEDHLPRLLHPPDSGKQNALELVSVRGNGHLIPKSDLEFFEDFK
jgi:hypothetical protein